MVKKKGLWYTLKYYEVPRLIITGLILGFIATFTIIEMEANIHLQKLDYRTDLIAKALIIGYAVYFWFKQIHETYRSQKYRYITGRSYGKDHSQYKRTYNELIEYFRNADPYKLPEDTLPKANWKESEGIILGKTKDGRLLNIQSGKDGKNYFIFGLPSSGKTAGPIICSCLRWGMNHPLSENNKTTDGSIFCIDLKNDIWKATHKYRNIKRFNLMDAEHSCHYNPFAGIERLSIDERCNYIENIGFNIIPEATSGDSKYFTDTAQDYWNGIALYMLSKDINTSFPDVIKAILAGNSVDWVKRVVEDGCEESKRRLQSKWGENEKNLSGGYSMLAQCCRKFASEKLFYLLGNDPQYEYISPQTLENGIDVYVQLDQAELSNYAALLSMIVQGFLNGFVQREQNPKVGRLSNGTLRPIAFILDEFAQLTNLKYENIATAFMTLRSRNISIICALQSRSSITQMFHSEEACMSLIDCVTTFAFLSIQEVQTREWASKLIGTKKVLKSGSNENLNGNGSQNSGHSSQEDREPIFQPADFGNLIDKATGRDEIIVYTQGKYIKLNKQYYFK